MKKVWPNIAVVFFTVFFLILPLVHADTTDVSQITAPLNKIYNLVKAVISVVAILAMPCLK